MAQRTDFSAMACSLARAWAVIGEPWTPLVLRDLALGMTRFEQFQSDLGIARNVLAERLRTLTAAGVVERRSYDSVNRRRDEYVLSEMGRELVPLIVALVQWGDRWLDDGTGRPVSYVHRTCGSPLTARVACERCGEDLRAEEIEAFAGPGASTGPGTWAAGLLPRRPA